MDLLPFVYIIAMSTSFTMQALARIIQDSSIVFVGTTPCSNVIRPLHKITPESDCALMDCHCIMVEWKLTLYTDPVTHEPTTYRLTGTNRYVVKETNMYSEPGTKTESEGKWIIIQGTITYPGAIVYELSPDKPGIALKCVRLNDNLIHILDRDERLMIGNEFWSYTLSRTSIE